MTPGFKGRFALLTPTEAAEVLRIGSSTMYRWIKQNKIPYVRLPSGDVRIKESDLEKWIEERTRRSA